MLEELQESLLFLRFLLFTNYVLVRVDFFVIIFERDIYKILSVKL